jgi:hypothetical protein
VTSSFGLLCHAGADLARGLEGLPLELSLEFLVFCHCSTAQEGLSSKVKDDFTTWANKARAVSFSI